ncbi:hypothetical protein [Anaerocolumna jejuensis]|uniref:hypothetical protein n=1 Tax=Anaerocolumna jejuensis TaxID=259063 RepID=UPI003F7BD0AA
MKLELKLSQRDKKLLLVAASLVLFAVSYFLIYQRNVNAAQEMKASNEALKSKVQELTLMQAQEGDKKEKTEGLRRKTEDMEARFPVNLSTADIILMLDDMEAEAGMQISSAAFTEHQIFYAGTASGDGAALSSQTADTTANTAASTSAGTTANTTTGTTANKTADTIANSSAGTSADTTIHANRADSENAAESNKFTGMKSTVSISFKTTYEGLKKAIDYINESSRRMTIGELNTTYDTATGNLTGSMTINMYMLTGSGVEKTYEPPAMDDIKTGRDNIFGTLK